MQTPLRRLISTQNPKIDIVLAEKGAGVDETCYILIQGENITREKQLSQGMQADKDIKSSTISSRMNTKKHNNSFVKPRGMESILI